jgi:hypothetical protein
VKIEAGKYYLSRDGRKFGPMVDNGGDDGWPMTEVGHKAPCWTRDGYISTHFGSLPADLIAEWEPTGPVITETVKRINPGVYGTVEVLSGPTDTYSTSVQITMRNGSAFSPHLWFDAAELRAAAATLTEIAEALEEMAS